jgi:choline kinase
MDLLFEAAIDPILDRHAFHAVPLDDLRAIEIDTPDDLSRARALWRSGAVM